MSSSPIESFRTHSNYIRAFATLLGADGHCAPDKIYPTLAEKITKSGCLPKAPRVGIDHGQILSGLKNSWGTEFLINMSKHFVDEHELVKLSNNWSAVQAYYVLYHSTQAVAVAKGHMRPSSHPKTQNIFYDLWASRNLCLEPWTIGYGADGPVNIPSHVVVDGSIHNWSHCSSDTAWSLAYKALRTTREDNLKKALQEAREKKRKERQKGQEKRIRRTSQGTNARKTELPRLTDGEKDLINKRESPATMIDYLYRLRIKTNYVDSAMFTDGPESDDASVQVRDDLSIIAGGSLLLAELTIMNLVGREKFIPWIRDWTQSNIPREIASGIRHRLNIYR